MGLVLPFLMGACAGCARERISSNRKYSNVHGRIGGTYEWVSAPIKQVPDRFDGRECTAHERA